MIDIQVKCLTADVLKTIKANKERHSAIVVEAREGYVEKAKAALEVKLESLKSGKLVALHFDLRPPKDYTSEYANAIASLELHQDAIIELSSSQIKMLIQDEWAWANDFLISNAFYSNQSQVLASERGLI